MKLREIKIKNFRCLAEVSVPIGDNTVLVGENNSGKTAFLEALGIALPRSAGRQPRFDEYDYFMAKGSDSPQSSDGVTIELWFREDASDEWPDPVIQALNEVIQTDPILDIDTIALRLTSKYDDTAKEMTARWQFLTLDGQPLGGNGAKTENFSRFLTYIRFFYLSSLRDSINEFSPRSQFWGRILRDLKIDDSQREALSDELSRINDTLLASDPRLEELRQTLAESQRLMRFGSEQETSIQALPLKPWDLMSKSQVVVKTGGTEIGFPLVRHGQGAQNLAVLFLFQAYIQILLKPTFEPETKAILALEEPEAHLHPQATRALAGSLHRIAGQKLISTHSPYFIQEIPFDEIRMFRREGPLSKVVYVKKSFKVTLPKNDGLEAFCKNNAPKFVYLENESALAVKGKMTETEYRRLLKIYPAQPEIHIRLKSLLHNSQMFLSEEDLKDLDTYAKRIRGEILFASGWLLCEGQSDYLLLRYFADLMGKPLDEMGVSVIDFQNNGSPGAFVGLARAFEIPWVMICDNDPEGKKFVRQVESRGLTNKEIESFVHPLPGEGTDLEVFLVQNGFADEYTEMLAAKGSAIGKSKEEAGFIKELSEKVKSDKVGCARLLVETLQASGAGVERVPAFIYDVLDSFFERVI